MMRNHFLSKYHKEEVGKEAAALVKTAKEAYRARDSDVAAKNFSAALAAGADETECRSHLARIYNSKKSWSDALEQWTWLLGRNPKHPEYQLQVARAHSALGNLAEARAGFRAVLGQSPNHEEARRALAKFGEELPFIASGENCREATVPRSGVAKPENKRASEDAANLLAAGKSSYAAGDFQASKKHFLAALAAGAGQPVCRLHLARIYNSEKNWTDALEQWRWLLQHDPAQPEPQLQVARAHLNLGNFREAETFFRAVLARSPEHQEALRSLSQIDVLKWRPSPAVHGRGKPGRAEKEFGTKEANGEVLNQEKMSDQFAKTIDSFRFQYPAVRVPRQGIPQVSIIIPVFNKFDMTYRCVSSIVAHGADVPFEIVIVDDCSRDETLLAAQAFEGAIRIVRNGTNMGFVRSCNRG